TVAPVRPIFVMNKEDDRIVENRDVAEPLQAETNLASMPWEDFEHLVSQLFEWEFGKNGDEVKVTRASRDRRVDAIRSIARRQIRPAGQALYAEVAKHAALQMPSKTL